MNGAMLAQTVGTLIVLGFFFVLFAGLYAAFYAAGRMFSNPWLVRVGYLFGLGQFMAAMGMVFSGFLDRFWVYLVTFSALAYLVIPPIMWRIVLAFHRLEESHSSL